MTPALVPEWVDASRLLPEADACVPEEKQAQVTTRRRPEDLWSPHRHQLTWHMYLHMLWQHICAVALKGQCYSKCISMPILTNKCALEINHFYILQYL